MGMRRAGTLTTALALIALVATVERGALAQPAGGADARGADAGGAGAGAGAEGAPAAPPAAGQIDDARSRMEKGQRLFADGKFVEAADEFTSAYDKHRFSAFLFNAAVAAERGALRERAIDLYDRFLEAEPTAPDWVEIDKTIARLKQEQASPPAAPTATSQKAEIKALIFVESEPAGAPVSIYEKVDAKAGLLDPKNPNNPGYRRVISGLTAPTNLSLNFGTYFLVVEGFRDYNPTGSQFSFEPGRVYVYRAGLSQGDFVGRVEISLPVAGAKIYVDDPPPHKHAPRAVGPNSIELAPGKHTIHVVAPGFELFEKEIDIVQGKIVKLDAQLERVKYGYLLVSGNADTIEVEIDGEPIGEYQRRRREALRIRVPHGEHEIEVDGDGRKSWSTILTVPRGQEIAIDATLEEAPGKGGAVVTAIFAAGFLAGGIVLNRFVDGLDDSDGLKEPLNAVSIGCFAGAGAFTGLAIFLFVWDPDEDSSAKILPAREFTGETAKPSADPRTGARLGSAIGVGLLGAPPAPPGAPPSLAVPAGLSLSGTF